MASTGIHPSRCGSNTDLAALLNKLQRCPSLTPAMVIFPFLFVVQGPVAAAVAAGTLDPYAAACFRGIDLLLEDRTCI
jgi:hypothetical protein